MSCITRFRVLRGTTAQRLTFTPLDGELFWDTTASSMYVGDGVTVGGVGIAQTALDLKVSSDTTGVTGADQVTNMISLTQAEYDAIVAKNESTFYLITDAV
jgi:hypothetical protein